MLYFVQLLAICMLFSNVVFSNVEGIVVDVNKRFNYEDIVDVSKSSKFGVVMFKFEPRGDLEVTEVVDGPISIWECERDATVLNGINVGSGGDEKDDNTGRGVVDRSSSVVGRIACRRAILLCDGMIPFLLMLHLSGSGELTYKLYYECGGTTWFSIGETEYYYKMEGIRPRKRFELNVSSGRKTKKLKLSEYRLMGIFVKCYRSSHDYLITKVVDANQLIWESDEEYFKYGKFYALDSETPLARIVARTPSGVVHHFYYKFGGKWRPLDFVKFKNLFNLLKPKNVMKLDINKLDTCRFTLVKDKMNDATLLKYTPHVKYDLTNGYRVGVVRQGNFVIWKYRETNETCTKALVLLAKNGKPSLLHLNIKQGDKKRTLTYKRRHRIWIHVQDETYYPARINRIKDLNTIALGVGNKSRDANINQI